MCIYLLIEQFFFVYKKVLNWTGVGSSISSTKNKFSQQLPPGCASLNMKGEKKLKKFNI